MLWAALGIAPPPAPTRWYLEWSRRFERPALAVRGRTVNTLAHYRVGRAWLEAEWGERARCRRAAHRIRRSADAGARRWIFRRRGSV